MKVKVSNRLNLGLALVLIAITFIYVTPAQAAQPQDDEVGPHIAQNMLWYIDKDTKKPKKHTNDSKATPLLSSGPIGYVPADIIKAYNFPVTYVTGPVPGTAYSWQANSGYGQTIAIIDSGSSQFIYEDLTTFSQQFGLPVLPQCVPNDPTPCFKQVNSRGSTAAADLPPSAGWEMEIALDVEWAHAIAPGAKIVLVAADNTSVDALVAAVDYARESEKAGYISMSWGAGEWSTVGSWGDPHFPATSSTGKAVSYFAASGDWGNYDPSYVANGTKAFYPATSSKVIAVGGTTLTRSSSGSFSETGWGGSGGGCSYYLKSNTAQTNFFSNVKKNTFCANGTTSSRRATPDVSLVADPYTGVTIYFHEKQEEKAADGTVINTTYVPGWANIGGTSASAPMVAARSAVKGVQVNSTYVYGSSITYRDITSGNNGYTCRAGYDLVTGRGSWTK